MENKTAITEQDFLYIVFDEDFSETTEEAKRIAKASFALAQKYASLAVEEKEKEVAKWTEDCAKWEGKYFAMLEERDELRQTHQGLLQYQLKLTNELTSAKAEAKEKDEELSSYRSLLDDGVDEINTLKAEIERLKEGGREVDELAKHKNMACWMVPVSYLNPEKVEWGYEIEILPYSEMGRYFHKEHESNFVYSYQEWKTYDEAKKAMIERASELFQLFLKQNTKP